MKGSAALRDRSVTEADVIAWLQADYRLRAGVDPEVDPGASLTAATTIADWRMTCDLIGTRRLAKGMNGWLGVRRPVDEWCAVLEPEETRTLGDLAHYVAPHLRMATFSPMVIAGHPDGPTGAFFALRRLMAEDASQIPGMRPSTTVASLEEYQVVALGEAIAKLAPDLTPQPTIVPSKRQRTGGALAAIAFLVSLIGFAASHSGLGWGAAGLCIVGLLLTRGRPARIEFGGFETVGDIARAVAAHGQAAA